MFTSTEQIELQAQSLALTWKAHFAGVDANLRFERVEEARFLQLSDDVWLVGIVDAEGDDWFGEWKTSNPRAAKTWKREWAMSVQALTYGLLTGGKKRFLVRKVFKSAQPTCDHEWFQFGEGELEMWRDQVLMMAGEINEYKKRTYFGHYGANGGPWPLNLEHGCFAYGPNYACPFWAEGCSKLDFKSLPKEATPAGDNYLAWGEFQGENLQKWIKLREAYPNALLLSASRIKDWQRCRESYRRKHVEGIVMPPSEAMLIGSRFHSLIAEHYRSMTKENVNG
jgi:hypothetical protein